MKKSLEERLVGCVVAFDKEEKPMAWYTIKSFPSEKQPRHTILEINFVDYLPSEKGRTIFSHFVYFEGDKMVGERTSQVGEQLSDRHLYLKFLAYSKKHGIKLTNSFEQLWAENPGRYPL